MTRSDFLKGYNGPYKSAQAGCRINESPDLILWFLHTRAASVQLLVNNKARCYEPLYSGIYHFYLHLSRFVNPKLFIGQIRLFKTQY